ncbi:MAG TPA: dTDP-glucose 4,6-dehydratase [Candidatus Sumerlaeota bacterium]|nr:dTDP-glucose 4,6-dehydratase [Candidatus Sumerlaeota bacterium]
MRVLVTGGCGFIGSNFVRHLLETYPDYEIVNLDALTYAGNLANLQDVADSPRYTFVHGRIEDTQTVENIVSQGVDAIVNFAAESHVDRSILDASAFLTTNVMGTQNLLDAARRHKIGRFLQVSTDEVYGELGPEGYFTETTPLAPRSPYSASKTAADHLVLAAFSTFGLPVLITRCCNNYGPWHFPEKLIPLMILNAMRDKPLPVYGNGRNVRDWIYVLDHCRAIDRVLHAGRVGEVYNVGSRCERENIEVVREILAILGKPESLIAYVEDRLGHDKRYAIDPHKIETELGWKPIFQFPEALRSTVRWYQEHTAWWQEILSGEYQSYYETLYGNRKSAQA